MHRDGRSYYDESSSGGQYPTGQYPSPGGDYPSPSTYNHTSYEYPQSPAQYYPSNGQPSDASSHPGYYRSMTPGIHSHRYSNSASSREYYSQSGILNSSSSLQQPYNTQDYPNNQYPSNSFRNQSPPGQFIPTPSEMVNSYSNYPPALSPHSPQSVNTYGPGANGYSNPAMLPQPPLRPRISTGRPRTASGATTSPTSATSPSGERFPCEKCGKTFSRSHDRKRHHETQHLPTPVLHRCRFCEKEFSRADSLKRHLDNGCDEMPQ